MPVIAAPEPSRPGQVESPYIGACPLPPLEDGLPMLEGGGVIRPHSILIYMENRYRTRK
jgi:hypothetical protein